ncbi:cytosine-purine permease [Ophiostoma piceae UAMH 11346]|uniref:Cytosine-purine permease n=1 Tax=Ophiostoma piceae (strain UAMH 11346) TaxID=1262450 RepID=S3BNN0_OPHP1|nr:cytosine-purine permease [Ophiostoma piceae UAMH 11346]
MVHPRELRYLFMVKSFCAIVAAFSLLGWVVHKGGAGPIFSQTAKVSGTAKSWTYLAGINVVVSIRTTLALTLYGCKPSVTYWQALYIPIIYWIFSFMGIVIASAGNAIYGTVSWDPTTIVAHWDNRAAAFFCAFAFGLATLGTNISTNSVAASNDLAFMIPRWINLRRGSVIVAILGGWATAPWKIQTSATSLTTFLSGYAIVLAPILSVVICDYYIVRKGRVHVHMLYQNDGIYRYFYGVNWRAVTALVAAVPVNLPGLIHAINPTVYVGNYIYFYKASWLTAMTISGGTYTILSMLSPPHNTFVEDSALEEPDGLKSERDTAIV